MDNTRTLTVIMVLASLFISMISVPVMAQQPATGDWNAVQSLSPGEEIVVGLKDRNEVKGKFLDAGAGELTIMRKGKHESFARDSIAEIHQVKGKAKKGKFALIGAGSGFGIGQIKNGPNVEDGEIYPLIGTLMGAGIGAVSGFFIGQTRRNRVLVYRAH
jgi:Zn-dependent alcohol dehydrogenase